MTVDVDGWSSLLKFYSIDHNPYEASIQVRVEEGIIKLLQLFKKHEIKTTFFITGKMALENAPLILKIYREGHEVACHGLTHEKNEFLLDKNIQKMRIVESTKIIKKIIGKRPIGFRAPCLRINEITTKILEDYEYIYDSSVVPTIIPGYYGFPLSPRQPYYPSSISLQRKGSCKLLEIPISVNPIIPLPLSAAWMRNFGLTWVKSGVKANFILNNIVMFYIHPRDVLNLPKVKGVPWHIYRNTGEATLEMLDDIIKYAKLLTTVFMKTSDFVKVVNKRRYLNEHSFNSKH